MAQSAPSCVLLFDGLRVEFCAITAAATETPVSATSKASAAVLHPEAGIANPSTGFDTSNTTLPVCSTGGPSGGAPGLSENAGMSAEDVGAVRHLGVGGVESQAPQGEMVRVLSVVRDEG